MEFILVLLAAFAGGFVGFAVNIANDHRIRREKCKHFKRMIECEMSILKEKLVLSALRIKSKLGTLDEDFIRWFYKEQYRSLRPNEDTKALANKLKAIIEKGPDSLAELRNFLKASEYQSLNAPTIHLAYLDETIENIGLLNGTSAELLLDIRSQVSFLNETAENNKVWFERTFSELNESSKKANESNIDRAIVSYANRAISVCDKIDKLLSKL